MPYGEHTYQYLARSLMTSGSSELHWHKTAEVRLQYLWRLREV